MTPTIHATDPDAIAKITAKLAELEANQDFMKRMNKIIRQYGNDALPWLIKEGLPMEAAQSLLRPSHPRNIGYTSWMLGNNNKEIRRLKIRLVDLKIAAQRQDREFVHPTFVAGQDAGADRVWFSFAAKPSKDIRTMLKRSGFKWAPSKDRWQRQWTVNAETAQSRITQSLNKASSQAA